jgi:hypothetical protein
MVLWTLIYPGRKSQTIDPVIEYVIYATRNTSREKVPDMINLTFVSGNNGEHFYSENVG